MKSSNEARFFPVSFELQLAVVGDYTAPWTVLDTADFHDPSEADEAVS